MRPPANLADLQRTDCATSHLVIPSLRGSEAISSALRVTIDPVANVFALADSHCPAAWLAQDQPLPAEAVGKGDTTIGETGGASWPRWIRALPRTTVSAFATTFEQVE